MTGQFGFNGMISPAFMEEGFLATAERAVTAV
jgi:hypothetical protein